MSLSIVQCLANSYVGCSPPSQFILSCPSSFSLFIVLFLGWYHWVVSCFLSCLLDDSSTFCIFSLIPVNSPHESFILSLFQTEGECSAEFACPGPRSFNTRLCMDSTTVGRDRLLGLPPVALALRAFISANIFPCCAPSYYHVVGTCLVHQHSP